MVLTKQQAVARALYPRAEVVLLDDLFSALDRPTANAIFRNLFGANGLLTTLKSTVVLATHSGKHCVAISCRYTSFQLCSLPSSFQNNT